MAEASRGSGARLSARDQLPRTKVPLEQEYRDEDRGDDQYFLNAAALDARADHEQGEHDREDRADGDDECAAAIHGYALADGGSGSPVPGCVGFSPMMRRFTHASGS